MDLVEIEAAVEALLFSAGDVLSTDRLCDILSIDKKTLKSIVNNMMDKFANSGRGIIIREINNGYQMCTNPSCFEYVKMLVAPRQKPGLSQAAFETLSIIAYKQPVTKARIEQIRGVSSDSAIARLMDRNLIKEAGRLEAPGRPILYETTEEFLRSFGFRSAGDLPVLSMNDMDTEEEAVIPQK